MYTFVLSSKAVYISIQIERSYYLIMFLFVFAGDGYLGTLSISCVSFSALVICVSTLHHCHHISHCPDMTSLHRPLHLLSLVSTLRSLSQSSVLTVPVEESTSHTLFDITKRHYDRDVAYIFHRQ